MNDSYGGLSKCKSVKAAFCVDSFSACRLFSQSIRSVLGAKRCGWDQIVYELA